MIPVKSENGETGIIMSKTSLQLDFWSSRNKANPKH